MEKINEMVDDFIDAHFKALEKQFTEDNGTCNMDNICIKLNLSKLELELLQSKIPNFHISDKLTGYWKNYRFLDLAWHGQADLRTAMVRNAFNHLKEKGYDVRFYSQMD